MSERRRTRDPGKMSPRAAKDRYLRRRRNDATASTIESFHGRLKLFVEWCEAAGIPTVGELYAYDVNDYYDLRSGEARPATVEGEMYTLKKFVEFLEGMGAVEDGLAEKVPIPDVPEEARSSDTKLGMTEAFALIRNHRHGDGDYGTRAHVFLELAWFTGARMGGIRALDIRDVDLDANYVEFRHRPETDTPLKNKLRGERPVAIPEETSRAIELYLNKYRYDTRDDYGRQPLLASARGRPSTNTMRVWSYLATLPCNHGPCPHGKDRHACEWTERRHASKCPSSRSPHQLRTGSITWQLNAGVPIEIVAERVNATKDVIEQHYDKPDKSELWRRRREQMERRRSHIDDLDLTHDDDE